MIASLKPARRGLFHAEFVANAEAEEEEENGAEDGLEGRKHYEQSERRINCQTEIPAEAEDVEGVRGAEAQGFPIGTRIAIPEGGRAYARNHNKCAIWAGTGAYLENVGLLAA
jgi:hypothetical protein